MAKDVVTGFWTAMTGHAVPVAIDRSGCATHRRRTPCGGQFPKNSDLASSVGRGLLGSRGIANAVFYVTGKGVPELPFRRTCWRPESIQPPPWWRVILREASAACRGQPPADLPGFTNVNLRVGAVARNTCRLAPSATEASSKIWRKGQPTSFQRET
jgi:hypothetical protein